MERYEAYKDSGVEWIGEIPVGWKTARMGTSCYLKGRIGWQGLKAEEFIDDGPYLVTGTDFCNGRVNWKTCYHISQDRFEEAPEIHVRNGDLLITKDGTIGKLALICDAPNAVSLNSHLLLLRPLDGQIDSRFLFWVLSGEEFSHYTDISQSGTIMASLSQDKIARFIYAVPSLEEQQAIADFLDTKTAEIDGLVADCEREVELLQEYRKAAISEAVTKGLDPNAPMKDSGVEWIGEIPEGWAATSLQRIGVTIEQGWSPSPARDWVDGCWGVLSLSAIKNGHFLPNEVKPVSIEEKIPLGLKLQNGDLLVTRSNTRELVGDACLVNHVDDRTVFSDLIYRLTLSASTIDSKFALYALLSVSTRVQFAANAKGSSGTMPKINHRIIKQLRICLPPLIDQRAIVAYLDAKTAAIDSLIDSKRQMIEKLREYRKSLISEAVTGKFKVPGV